MSIFTLLILDYKMYFAIFTVNRPEVIKRFYANQLNMKFILLINVKMPAIVGILT